MRHLLFSGLLLACAVYASAYDRITDGQTVRVTNNTTVWEYVPTATGILTIESNTGTSFGTIGDATLLYTSPEHGLDQGVALLSTYYDNAVKGRVYNFGVEEGVTYYFWADYVNDGINPPPSFTFKFTEGSLPPQVLEVYPTPGRMTPYNFFTYPDLQIMFNQNGDVRFESVNLVYQTETGEKTQPIDYNEVLAGETMRYDFKLREAVGIVKSEMLDKSNFSVSITGATLDGRAVQGLYTTSEGNLQFDYYYERLTSAVSVVKPDVFLSYWPENDPDGIITITFDGDLAPLKDQKDMQLAIYAGPYKDGDAEWPQLEGAPVTIDGNVLSIDLCGVVRETKETTVTIRIYGVVNAEGAQIDYYGNSVIDIVEMPYQLLGESTLSYDFMPADGNLADVAEIEFYITDESLLHVRVDGFEFTYKDAEEPVVLTTDDVTVNTEDGGVLYLVPVPALIKSAVDVVLSVQLFSLDGFDYNISASFNASDGVTAIEADAAEGRIFTITGLPVSGNPESLPAGVYIIGGKKVIR